jgi:hypothetical protein
MRTQRVTRRSLSGAIAAVSDGGTVLSRIVRSEVCPELEVLIE